MKNLLKLYTAICIVISFSCNIGIGSRRINGNGKIASDARNVSIANKIRVTGDMDVIVNKGNTRVKVEADENIIPYIIK